MVIIVYSMSCLDFMRPVVMNGMGSEGRGVGEFSGEFCGEVRCAFSPGRGSMKVLPRK